MDATQPKSKFLKALQKLQAVAEKETTIAVLMAFVAMLGMVTAYRTATAEEEVLLKEGRLTQSRFLELSKREEALVRFADSARFEVAREMHLRKLEIYRSARKRPDLPIAEKPLSLNSKHKRRLLSPGFSSPMESSPIFLTP